MSAARDKYDSDERVTGLRQRPLRSGSFGVYRGSITDAAPKQPQPKGELEGVRRRKRLRPGVLLAPFAALLANRNKLLINAYRFLGFALLVGILLGIASYLGLQVFFLADRAWMTPAVVSPTDPKVLQATAQIAQETLVRDKLEAERADLVARVRELERTIALETAFQERLKAAIDSDLEVKQAELKGMQSLARRASSGASKIAAVDGAFADMSKQRMKELRAAGLMNDDAYLTGHHQLASLELTHLSAAERSATLKRTADELARQSRALDAARAELSGAEAARGPLHGTTLELARLRHDYDIAGAAVARSHDLLESAKLTLAATEAASARHAQLIAALRGSPYFKAAESKITVAFVPYENAAVTAAGTPIYACKLGPLWCEQVGTVVGPLPGEVVASHPVRNQELRGTLVEIELGGRAGAEHAVLHARRPPLLL